MNAKKYRCLLCSSYEYDEEQGEPEREIPQGTKWEDLPFSFTCKACGGIPDSFDEVEESE